MPTPARDEGEFELILDNKQIGAVFVIVLLLIGLFFSIGFIAGRRSAAGDATAAVKQPAQAPMTVEPSRREREPETQSQAAQAPPKEAPAPEPQAADQRPAPKRESAVATPVPATLYVEQPPAGAYLQAAATRRADAEAMLSYIMGKTGLKGYVAPSPKSPELCRVLIGPLSSNEQIAEARAKLGALGVTNAYPVKY